MRRSEVRRRRATGGAMVVALVLAGVPLAAAQDRTFHHLSVQQGLSHGAVRAILQDSIGFMWFGTEDGLNRYDGISIVTWRHDPADSNTLASSNFGKLLQDRDGIMWYGTWGGGVDRYDPATGRFTHHRHDPADSTSISQDRVEFIYQDRAGRIWIGTPNRGLNRLLTDGHGFRRYRHDPDDSTTIGSDAVKAVVEDGTGVLWFGTDEGLSRYEVGGTFQRVRHDPRVPSSITGNLIRSLALAPDGRIWVGTRGGGLDLFDPATGRARHFRHDPGDPGSLSDDEIARVFMDSYGALWVGTYDAGLNLLEPGSDSFIHFRHDPNDPTSLAHDRVEAIYQDRGGVLWLGTIGGGVDRIDLKPGVFTNYYHDPADARSLPHPAVRALAVEAGGAGLWVGTDGGGLALFDPDRGVRRRWRGGPGRDRLAGDRIWSLLAAGPDSLWVGTFGEGLNLLVRHRGRWAVRRFPALGRLPGAPGLEVKSLARDPSGGLWMGTADGLFRMGPGSGSARPRRVPGLPMSHRHINTLRAGRSGSLWIGTVTGLFRLHFGSMAVDSFPARPGQTGSLQSDIITAILESDTYPGTVWVGTEDGGLDRLDPAVGVVAQYLAADGLPSNVISSLVEDERGHLWIATSQGISRLDPVTGSFVNYGISDGLTGNSFVTNAQASLPSGRLFFGSITGMASVAPDSVRANPHIPPLALTSFRVFNEELPLAQPLSATDRIVLPNDRNFVTIEFAALDYTAPNRNQYLYRMFGADPDWIDAGNRPFANYAGLAPGHYTFWVRGSNNNGVWNHTGASIDIVIRPPWWGTWWFRVGSVLLLGLVLVRLFQYRTRRISARARELEAVNASLNDQILKRRQAEDERERLIPELEARNTELERFTYTVSHDLKSPLVTITGFLGLLERDMLTDSNPQRVRRDLDQIRSAAGKMQQLLDELLDLSRAGHLVNPPTAVDLGEVVQEVLVLLDGQIKERGVTITVTGDLPVLYGDRIRLAQVTQNLVHNAITFMGDQEDPVVEIGSRQNDEEWIVWIRDNGIGIEPEYHETIFGLFNQLDPGGGGTGIGLALVKRIIEVYGGRVWVESAGAQLGSAFFFSLPLGLGKETGSDPAAASGPAQAPSS